MDLGAVQSPIRYLDLDEVALESGEGGEGRKGSQCCTQGEDRGCWLLFLNASKSEGGYCLPFKILY